MSTDLSPLLPATLADRCADRLRHLIVAGRLALGERLPSEARLAEELGVSRLTLRSALSRLVAEDLLEVRHGSGYRVRPFLESGSPRVLAEVVAQAVEEGTGREVAADLLRVRRHLAVALVEKLVEVQPPLAEARVAVAAFTEAATSGASLEVLAERDADVLDALVRATGSPLLRIFLHPVRQILSATPSLAAAMYARPLENAGAWSAFLDALEAGALSPAAVIGLLAARDTLTLNQLELP